MLFASCAQIFAMHVEKNAISMIWIIAGYAQKFVFIAPKNVQAWLQRNVNFNFCLVDNRYPVTFAPHIAK